MNKTAEQYIEQYHNGLITLGELADKLREVDEQEPKSCSITVRTYAQSNLDAVKYCVMNECACHWGFFRENCPEPELDSFCNIDFLRSEDEVREFVCNYI